MLRNSASDYGLISKLLHLISAIVVFGMFALGYWMVDLGYYDDWYKDAPFIHRSIGILFIGLLAFRLLWKAINIKPQPLSQARPMENKIAHIAHTSLYAFMIVLVISGYLISTADGTSISVFNWFEVPAPKTFLAWINLNNLADIAGFVHKYMAYALIGLVFAHIAGVLYHHYGHKDRTFSRMFKFK